MLAPSLLHASAVVGSLRKDVAVAGQNCWHGPCGAFTGEIAAEQLRDVGCSWVLLGHSERRLLSHESNEYVSRKVLYARQAGLAVVACLGETADERAAGSTVAIVSAQLAAIAASLTSACWTASLVIAYEPVWAIGTGAVATPQQAQEVHAAVRAWIREHVGDAAAEATRIVYGGSVTAASAPALAAMRDIDGFLVGGTCACPPLFVSRSEPATPGASLRHEFVDIVRAAEGHVYRALSIRRSSCGVDVPV